MIKMKHPYILAIIEALAIQLTETENDENWVRVKMLDSYYHNEKARAALDNMADEILKVIQEVEKMPKADIPPITLNLIDRSDDCLGFLVPNDSGGIDLVK